MVSLVGTLRVATRVSDLQYQYEEGQSLHVGESQHAYRTLRLPKANNFEYCALEILENCAVLKYFIILRSIRENNACMKNPYMPMHIHIHTINFLSSTSPPQSPRALLGAPQRPGPQASLSQHSALATLLPPTARCLPAPLRPARCPPYPLRIGGRLQATSVHSAKEESSADRFTLKLSPPINYKSHIHFKHTNHLSLPPFS